MKAAIIVDSTAGLSEEYLNREDVYIVYLSTIFPDGTEFVDSTDESIMVNFYQKMASEKELPTTSQPSPQQVYDVLDDIVRNGYDTVFGLFISSKISGTYQTVYAASKNYQDQLNFHLLDSKITSYCMEGLFINLTRLLESQRSPHEIEQQMLDLIEDTNFYFTISTLDNLVKGGRVNALTGMIGNLLKIKPIITLGGASNGEANVYERVRSRKKAIARMEEITREQIKQYPDDFYITIGHTGAVEDAQAIQERFAKDYPDKNIRVGYISPVLGTHGGINAVSINTTRLLPIKSK